MAQQKKTNSKKNTATGGLGSSKKSSTQTKKDAAAGKAASTAKKPAKENKRTIAKKKSFFGTELKVIAAIVLGGFMLLTDIGLMGSVGSFLLKVQRGLFGQGYALFGIAIVAAAMVAMKYKDTYFVKLKVVCVFGLLIVGVSLIHIIFSADGENAGGLALKELYLSQSLGEPGGGVIGGSIANLLKGTVGYAGSYLVLVALLIAFFVLITEKSFVNAAKIGASKTAQAVKSGAGMTVEAAKHGQERYREIHRENVIRRDAKREENRLRKLEASFPEIEGIGSEALGAADTGAGTGLGLNADYPLSTGGPELTNLDSEYDTDATDAAYMRKEAARAELYANYGRDIIGDGQPGVETLENARTPLFGTKYTNNRRTEGVSFDTAVLDNGFDMPSDKPESEAVNIRAIDYDSDEVPFDETTEDKYKSYAHILESGELSMATAQRAGFAVDMSEHAADSANTGRIDYNTLKHMDAFEVPKTAATAAAGNAANAANTVNTIKADRSFDSANLIEFANSDNSSADSGYQNGAFGTQYYNSPDAALKYDTEYNQEYDANDVAYFSTEDDSASASQSIDEPKETYNSPGYNADNKYADNKYADNEYADNNNNDNSNTDDEGSEEYYTTAGGKQLKSPDSYEVGKILSNKGILPAEASNGAAVQQQPKPEPKPEPKPTPKPKPKPRPYVYPRVNLLEKGTKSDRSGYERLRQNASKLQTGLRKFGVGVSITNITVGPRVSRYELTLDAGVKVSRITSLTNDIKLMLAAKYIRIEAPIPGKSAVGVEVPNEVSTTVKFRDILESEEFKNAKSRLSWGVGLDIGGNTIICDVSKMPHILVSGTTGSGKSVGINSLIMSVLYRATPQEVRMILVDPKQVEFTVYNGIPHLLTEVVTTPDRALSALNWAVAEMNRRYKLFQDSGTRNIKGYNEKLEKVAATLPEEDRPEKLPFILIIIDELSELMMHAKKDVESCIVSLAQLARAAGIHLVVATQRPSVDVVTGLIKSNIPSRVAFKLPSVTDSRTILDSGGAESLLGNGDMLYKPGDKSSPIRVQGAFLSDEEVENVVSFIKKHNPKDTDPEIDTAIAQQLELNFSGQAQDSKSNDDDTDENFADAGRLIITSNKASIGGLQRKFKIGFNRAARIMDQLCEAGVVSDGEGTKERRILMTMEEFEELLNTR